MASDVVLDSSAIIAILKAEPGCDRLERKIDEAGSVYIGAPTVLETAMVLTRIKGSDQRATLDAYLRRINARVIAFTEDHYLIAAEAHVRFGRGFDSKANLNFGDCLTYATAKLARDTLLFVGRDFGYTDIQVA